ncbi:MAG: YraN family protein [Acidimicrobiales bacterium]
MQGSVEASPRRRSSLGRRQLFGKWGEGKAAAWYESHGYEVLARNWSCREGELDIVARRQRLYIFCEVKSRANGSFGLPAEAVGPLKQARLRRLAARWFATAGDQAKGGAGPVRFDVACVLGDAIEVVEEAF